MSELNDASAQDQDIPIAFSGEVMLKDWSESSRDGRTVTLRLSEDEPEHPFRKFTSTLGKKTGGQRFMTVFVMINDDETFVKEVAQKPYGKNASMLHRSGWFFDSRVLKALGTPESFVKWAYGRECVICKMSGSQHVLKGPGYTAIPVCDIHRSTNVSVLASHQPKVTKVWVSEKICEIAGVESLGYLNPDRLAEICENLGIKETLPDSYFEKN